MEFQHKAARTRQTPANGSSHDGPERELAHKLGNLLQVIHGNLELLATRIEDEQLRGYIRNAEAAAGELTEIAHALADVREGGA